MPDLKSDRLPRSATTSGFSAPMVVFILSLARYFRFYCHRRIHQALGYRTPAEVYFEAA